MTGGFRRRHAPVEPASARFVTGASLAWVLRNRAWTPWYLLRYWRFLKFRLANPHVITTGFVFLGKRVEVHARPGYGRLVLGRWVHVGDGTSLRCHEGTLRIGDKTVFGRNIVVNAYLDIEIGAACIIADLVYIADFDHVFADVDTCRSRTRASSRHRYGSVRTCGSVRRCRSPGGRSSATAWWSPRMRW